MWSTIEPSVLSSMGQKSNARTTKRPLDNELVPSSRMLDMTRVRYRHLPARHNVRISDC